MFFSINFPSCTGSILLSFIKSFGSFTISFFFFFFFFKAVEDAAIPLFCLYVMAHNTPLPSPSSSPTPYMFPMFWLFDLYKFLYG